MSSQEEDFILNIGSVRVRQIIQVLDFLSELLPIGRVLEGTWLLVVFSVYEAEIRCHLGASVDFFDALKVRLT